ncbi:hypothetical protein VSH64_14010 [Amycolatopsis rhabdoformis]|uniref:Uncharacterized protein n=1 Tax=Amycolatopsis rhabdoformis TaxID=1448059 RepID=A0ABZ1II52_9PSEU|nr:hypothetical protein [Amycolatopsis rhabdoformis]WSE33214.1 hypothetical protein VSH64_14010 [Amycolatopsis rhabdoformis]
MPHSCHLPGTSGQVASADAGYAIEQGMPAEVTVAYERLVNAGYTARLIETS